MQANPRPLTADAAGVGVDFVAGEREAVAMLARATTR